MVLDASLLNTQHYKVHIKGKWSNPGKGVVPSLTPRYSDFWKGSLWICLWPTYWLLYIYVCVCVCVCMYVYVCTCIYVCAYLFIYVCAYVRVCMCVFLSLSLSLSIYIYIYICMCVSNSFIGCNSINRYMCMRECIYVCVCIGGDIFIWCAQQYK